MIESLFKMTRKDIYDKAIIEMITDPDFYKMVEEDLITEAKEVVFQILLSNIDSDGIANDVIEYRRNKRDTHPEYFL